MQQKKTMSLTADKLTRSTSSGRNLTAIVNEQIAIINEKIIKHDKSWGRNVIIHDLPTNISLPGITKQEAQLLLYSSIIRNLLNRKFDVKIRLEDQFTSIYVAWTIEFHQSELETMRDLIKSSMIKPEDVNKFLNGTLPRSQPLETRLLIDPLSIRPRYLNRHLDRQQNLDILLDAQRSKKTVLTLEDMKLLEEIK